MTVTLLLGYLFIGSAIWAFNAPHYHGFCAQHWRRMGQEPTASLHLLAAVVSIVLWPRYLMGRTT